MGACDELARGYLLSGRSSSHWTLLRPALGIQVLRMLGVLLSPVNRSAQRHSTGLVELGL